MLGRTVTTTLALTIATLTVAATVPTRVQDPEMERPSAHHARVLQGAGTWKGTLTAFMPGMPAEPIEAREEVEAVGKFWTRSRFECVFMGMPYVGAGCMGYSAKDETYVGTWTDSMSSYLAVMEGEYDAKRDMIVMRWDAPDMTGQMSPHRFELVMNADSYTSTFFVGADEGTKSMVIEMKRIGGKKGKSGAK